MRGNTGNSSVAVRNFASAKVYAVDSVTTVESAKLLPPLEHKRVTAFTGLALRTRRYKLHNHLAFRPALFKIGQTLFGLSERKHFIDDRTQP